MSQSRSLTVLLAILALVICTGTLQATATLVANPTSVTLNCDTLSGPTAVPIGITLFAAGAGQTVTVTGTAGLASGSGGPVVLPASNTVSSISTAVVFSIIIAPGCKGTNPGGTMDLIFTPAVGTALNVPVTLNITTSHGSALAPSPSSVSFTCNSTSGVVGAAQTVNVSSAATNGTPFTIGASPALPSWLTVSAGGTATGTPIALTVTAIGGSHAGCALLASGTTTFPVQLLNAPAPAVTLNVSVLVGASTPLTAATNPVAITHSTSTLFSAYNTEAQTTVISSVPTPLYFSVDLTTVPSWLSVNVVGGILTGAATNALGNPSLNFQPASGVTGLYVGNYTANVHLKVSGYLDYVLPVTIQVNNSAPTLSILQGGAQSINWVIGAALPTVTVTPISTDAPIAFSVTTSGNLGAIPSTTQGLAYNFGSPFTVSFTLANFGAFLPGTTQTGTITVTPIVNGTPGTAIPCVITVHVQPQTALITVIAPAILPTSTSGSFTVAVTGTGFVPGLGTTLAGIVVPASSPATMVSDANVVAVVQNTTSIVLTITVPSTADPYLPFSGAGGSVTIGVCNPLNGGSFCSSPTGTFVLTIGINPIVSAVTSASSYVEATPATVAPYDILSIFGTNFCVSGGTGCLAGGANALLYGVVNAATYAYPTTLSPDPAGATQRNLTVTFYPHASTTAFATAPLLFANNTQINLLAPSALSAHLGAGAVDMVVSFGYGAVGAATLLRSQIYNLNVTATDPGVFTIGGDGEGNAAALASPSYALITVGGPAIMRTTATNSDIVQLYVTGLGAPDSALSGGGSSATCVTAASYWGDVNTATSSSLTSDDGLVLQSSFLPNGDTLPCFLVATSLPTVTIGGQPTLVTWAGWVQGAVAGLYQINVQLPSSTPTLPGGTPAFTYAANNPSGYVMGTDIVSLPLVVTTAGPKSSQTGVNLWVEKELLAYVTGASSGPSSAAATSNPVYVVNAVHGSALSLITVVGAQGTTTYGFTNSTITGSVNGLTLSDITAGDLLLDAATGIVSGTPGAGMVGTTNYEITVTDSGTPALTGNVIISFVIT